MRPFVHLFIPLLVLQRSVLNSTDGQEVHGHGENIIVLRPTYQHPRVPDVSTSTHGHQL